MSERLRESVSALMDGETGELELRRLLSDPDQLSVRESWQSYHRLRVGMKAESAEFLHWDISERVSSAIGDDIPIIALTATATPKVQTDIVKSLEMVEPNIFISSFNRDNLYYEIRPKINKDSTVKSIIQFIRGIII